MKGRAAGVADTAMDLLVVPGFSKIGYEARRRMYGWEMPDLTGRSVMVTGASGGLGLAASIDLANYTAVTGYTPAGRRAGQTFGSVASGIRADGGVEYPGLDAFVLDEAKCRAGQSASRREEGTVMRTAWSMWPAATSS